MLTRRGLLRGLAQIAVLGPLALRRLPKVLEMDVARTSMIEAMERAFVEATEITGSYPDYFYTSFAGLRQYAQELLDLNAGRRWIEEPPGGFRSLKYAGVTVLAAEEFTTDPNQVLWANNGSPLAVSTPGATN